MEKKEAKIRIENLKREINHHRYLYHVLDKQEISETALDSLKHELTKLEQKFPEFLSSNSPSQRVGGKPLPGFKKVKHAEPMLSLNDVFSLAELSDWKERIKKMISPAEKMDYFAETKVDGFAVSLNYENGILKTGSTRGNGKIGEDVTENLKTIDSIPLMLNDFRHRKPEYEIKKIFSEFPRVGKAMSQIPSKLEIRGEIYMSKKVFAEINKNQEKKGMPIFANPRNIAAGSVRQLDPAKTAKRGLDFLAYDIITDLGQKTHQEEHLLAKVLGFKTVNETKLCHNLKEVELFWQEIAKKRKKLPLLIDGVVVQINESDIFSRLGLAGKAPRGAVAFKFPAEGASTLVEDIIVQVGRTGTLTPVAVLKPVSVGGVTVSRATLHNMDEIERLDVKIGDTVIVERAGDVIPAVVKVLPNLRPRNTRSFRMPENFCGQEVIRVKGESAYKIKKPEKCELVAKEKICHFVSKNAFDIQGLGPKITDKLLKTGLIRDPANLFTLKEGDLEKLEGFAKKSAEKLVRSIGRKKKTELPRFIYALGILHVGEETAIDLAGYFGNFKELSQASQEELLTISNIGETVAKSIYGWFRKKENQDFLKRLESAGVEIEKFRHGTRTGELAGKIFVLTGSLKSMSRNDAKKKIRMAGGEVSESISHKTSYVISGKEPGSKLEKAKKLEVKIIDEKEFLKLL